MQDDFRDGTPGTAFGDVELTVASVATERFFLVGFMGVGKTTMGRLVAERLGFRFIDLDDVIERSSGMAIAQIFALEGEASFRQRESEALETLLSEREPALIATGGGAFTNESNRLRMKEAGTVIWLDAPTEQILARIEEGSRPLWSTPERMRELHEQRRASYQEADHRLDLARAGPEEGAERLYRLVLGCRNIPFRP
jgi:shikimate kinase